MGSAGAPPHGGVVADTLEVRPSPHVLA